MSNELLIKKFLDIQDSIQIILKRTENIGSFEDFLRDEKGIERLDSISMRLQVIGEMVKNIAKADSNFFNSYPEINWKKIIGFRDVISRQYLEMDEEEVFNICKIHIPKLEQVVKRILSDLEKNKII